MSISHHAPTTLNALCACLAENTEGLSVLGGGTDLTIALRVGNKRPRTILRLENLPEAQGIRRVGESLEIGSAVTMCELAGDPELTGAYAALAHAAGEVGSEQIRSTATLGGNIANAAPGADTLPPLLLLGAEVLLASPTGVRWCSLESILPGGVGLSLSEAIVSIRLPAQSAGWVSAFHKLGSRKMVTISRLSLALGFRLEGNIICDCRAYAGAVGLRPLEVEAAQNLNGLTPDESAAGRLGEALQEFVQQTIPGRASMPYKSWAAKAVAADVMEKLCFVD